MDGLTVDGSLGSFAVQSSGAEVHFSRNENNDILANGGTSASFTIGANNNLTFKTGATLTQRLQIASNGDITFFDTDGSTASFVYDASAGLTINEAGADRDFRVESDTNTHALFVEAASSRIGVNNSAPDRPIHLKDAGNRNYIKAETTGTTDSEEAGFDVKAGSNNYLVGALGGTDNRFFIYDLTNSLDKFTIKQGDIIINDSGVDGDFRIESDGNANMLFVDAGANKVGIGISSPPAPFSVNTTPDASYGIANFAVPGGNPTWVTLNRDGSEDGGFKIQRSTTADMRLFVNSDEATVLNYNGGNTGDSFQIIQGAGSGALVATFDSGNNIIFNENSGDQDFRVESDGNANMLFVDGGNNRIGIGTGSPLGDVQIVTATAGTVFNVNHDTGGSYPKASGIGLGATSTAYTVSSDGGTVAFTGGAGIYAENTAASGNPTNLVFWTNLLGSPAEAMRLAGSGAATFSSTIALGDSKQIFFGADSDGRISFDGTDTLNITASNGSATTVNVTANNFKIGGASRLISGTANDSVVINEDSETLRLPR
jgi:hypothetical protein